MIKATKIDVLAGTMVAGDVQTWLPAHAVSDLKSAGMSGEIDSLKSQLQAVSTRVSAGMGSVAVATVPPAICSTVAAVESPYKTADGSLKSLVSVSFVNDDPNFAT